MRKFCLLFASIFGCALCAETVGNVEFQFPPSTNDWVLLTDSSTFCASEEDCAVPLTMKIYTHKTGDALEFFTAAYVVDDVDEETAEETNEPFQTAEFAQMFINDILGPYFPNHRITITKLDETEEEGFVEWELSDGIQVVLHGLCRCLTPKGNNVILSYMTTAAKNDDNTKLWEETLFQAKLLD